MTRPIVLAGSPSSAASRTGHGVLGQPGRADPGCRGRGQRSRHPMRAAAAFDQPGQPLGVVAAHPLVDRLPADPQLLGDLNRLVTGRDPIDEQLAAEQGEPGVSVRHEDLLVERIG